MIEAYYSLKRLPFQKDISPRDIFVSDSSRELSRRLEHMKRTRGFMLLTGAPETGKTLHVRTFSEGLNPNLYKVIYLPLCTVNIIEFYRQLSVLLGGESSWRKSQLFTSIQHSIKDYVQNHKKIPVIIFDEAHLLINENFYELQIIANFTMDSSDPALFILVGQQHLKDRLMRPVHQPFNQRITLKYHLQPFTQEETSAYIHHHLALAGLKEPPFTHNALAAIHQNSAGIPRVINSLCIKAMTVGTIEKKDVLTEEEVYRATQEL
jgi:type II secretory pathway predicted ATPase ExeA